ncbi:MAG: hypothetical protein HKN16_09125 [Saprospiraceae bacterium]|nr:hypothetical protein [Saprospiraceae bacterium]
MQRFLFGGIFLLFFSLSAFSQTSVSTDNSSLLGFASDDWTFFHNTEDDVVFIDFESINVNLHDIRVIDEKGELVLEEPLFDLPVDAIYELDLKNLPKGEFQVQLHTFNEQVITKSLSH